MRMPARGEEAGGGVSLVGPAGTVRDAGRLGDIEFVNAELINRAVQRKGGR
jgi:hypothetical protein